MKAIILLKNRRYELWVANNKGVYVFKKRVAYKDIYATMESYKAKCRKAVAV